MTIRFEMTLYRTRAIFCDSIALMRKKDLRFDFCWLIYQLYFEICSIIYEMSKNSRCRICHPRTSNSECLTAAIKKWYAPLHTRLYLELIYLLWTKYSEKYQRNSERLPCSARWSFDLNLIFTKKKSTKALFFLKSALLLKSPPERNCWKTFLDHNQLMTWREFLF